MRHKNVNVLFPVKQKKKRNWLQSTKILTDPEYYPIHRDMDDFYEIRLIEAADNEAKKKFILGRMSLKYFLELEREGFA